MMVGSEGGKERRMAKDREMEMRKHGGSRAEAPNPIRTSHLPFIIPDHLPCTSALRLGEDCIRDHCIRSTFITLPDQRS